MVNWLDPLKVDPSLLSLPVQSMAGVQPIEPPSAPGSDLNFVPSDQLKQFMLGKFDEPNIPSGVPSQEQQQQANVHRDIGNATANAVGSFQNIANIFRPGAGNPAMAESSRQYGESLAQRAFGDAQAKRQEAIQNMQLSDLSDQRRMNQIKMAQALMQEQMMKDPNSPLSKQAQARELSRLDALSSMTKDPQKLSILEQRKKMVPGVPAAMLAGAEQNDPLVKGMELESQERQAGAKLSGENFNRESEAQRRKDETALGWARLNEEKRSHDMAGAAKKQSDQLKLIGQQPKTVEEIGKLTNALENYDQALNLMKEKGIQTGYGPEYLQKAKGILPFTSQDPDWVDLWQKLQANKQSVRLGMEKTVRNNPFMIKQLEALFPEQEENTGTVKTKIEKLMGPDSILRNTLRSKIAELRRDPTTGEMIDKSAIAESLAPRIGVDAETLMKYIDDKPISAKPSSNPYPAGEIRIIKGGGKAQKQPDGSWKRIE